jgi:hypothetical protein
VIPSRLLLAAGTVAASVASVAPVASHGSPARALRLAPGASVTVAVPAKASLLHGAVSGSPALAARSRVTVVRASDGATVFVGSLATLRALPVKAGTKLVVRVDRPQGFAGLDARSTLSWS